MPRYAISLDTDSVTELAPHDPIVALETLAIRADTTFYNITVIPAIDTHFFGATVRFAFTATDDDVRAYCAYYDADLDVIEPLDA